MKPTNLIQTTAYKCVDAFILHRVQVLKAYHEFSK